MSMTATMTTGFDSNLKSVLPKLRHYAMSLTRDSDRADDLVQQTALKALAGRQSFRTGTNFAGWMFRIQRNEFISGLRRTRLTVDIDDASTLSERPLQENGLVMREFMTAFRQLPAGSRQALLLSNLEGQTYDQIAARAGISVGTVKSRVWRGRALLDRLLNPEPQPPRDAHPKHISPGASQCLSS